MRAPQLQEGRPLRQEEVGQARREDVGGENHAPEARAPASQVGEAEAVELLRPASATVEHGEQDDVEQGSEEAELEAQPAEAHQDLSVGVQAPRAPGAPHGQARPTKQARRQRRAQARRGEGATAGVAEEDLEDGHQDDALARVEEEGQRHRRVALVVIGRHGGCGSIVGRQACCRRGTGGRHRGHGLLYQPPLEVRRPARRWV
mmetsp:Transcript_60765/g.190523  ORF Transcript_60765/g.190523 Transcript_60765/m.190523 type:complete len:204 (-) Transcript_60765:23-634(-)